MSRGRPLSALQDQPSQLFTLPAANEDDGSPVTAGIIHLMMGSASQRRSFTYPDIRRSSFVRSLSTTRHLRCQRDLMTSLRDVNVPVGLSRYWDTAVAEVRRRRLFARM